MTNNMAKTLPNITGKKIVLSPDKIDIIYIKETVNNKVTKFTIKI